MASAVARLSLVSIATWTPVSPSARTTSGAVALIGSATAITPTALPSSATIITSRAVAAKFARQALERTDVDVRCLHSEPVAEREVSPVNGAGHALAGDALEALGFGEREIAIRRRGPDRSRERMLAAALEAGCELEKRVFADPRRGP
jgi:hypothetical protein